MKSANSDYFYTKDHLGSIREMVDSSGTIRARYDYDPYGRRTKVSGDMEADFGFTGYYVHQPSGLQLALYRAYDADTGRWLNRDPIGESGGINLYGYVGNDPINWIDPFGLALTDTQIANILFNETRSLSGNGIDTARQNVANAIINGDEAEDAGKGKRPKTAPDTAKVPDAEKKTYSKCQKAVKDARDQRKKGEDPTKGATHFNLRPNDSTADFMGNPIRTHNGPFENSYPTKTLPRTGIYVNTYK